MFMDQEAKKRPMTAMNLRRIQCESRTMTQPETTNPPELDAIIIGAGVGGLGVIALLLQRRRGWNAGRTQMLGDALILFASLPLLSVDRFALSILSAAAINAVLIVNHRPGRYIGY